MANDDLDTYYKAVDKFVRVYNDLGLIELSSINSSLACSNTGSIRDNPYLTSRKNSLEQIKLSSINKISLV